MYSIKVQVIGGSKERKKEKKLNRYKMDEKGMVHLDKFFFYYYLCFLLLLFFFLKKKG